MSDTDPAIFRWEAVDLISSTTVNGLLYGIALCLYILSARLFYPQLKDKDRKNSKYMFAHTSLVIMCGIIYFALDTRGIQLAYIDHNNQLGDPRDFESIFSTSQPAGMAMDAFSVMIDFLTIGIQIWRLWVIYGGTQFAIVIVILPTLLFLCNIVTTIIYVLPVGDDLFNIANETSIATQLAIEVFVTTMVIVRLLVVRRKHINSMGASEASNEYMSIATMLIESYALESAWSLAGLIVNFMSNSVADTMFAFFADCDGAIEVIAYLLVVYRVYAGRAWSKHTEEKISSLHFQAGQSTHSTTLETATQASQALPDDDMVANPLPPDDSIV